MKETNVDAVLSDLRYALGQVRRITTGPSPALRATLALDHARRAVQALERVEAVLVEAVEWDVRVECIDPSLSLADVELVKGGV